MQFKAERHSGKQVIVGIALALIAGIATPGMVPMVMIGSAALTFLYAYGGIAPFLVCALLQILTYDALGGLPLVSMGLLMITLPATLAVRGVRWRRPFAEQMRAGILLQFLGVLAAVFIAYLNFGSNLVGQLAEAYGSRLAAVPEEMLDELIGLLRGGQSAGETALTAEERAQYIAAMTDLLRDTLSMRAAGMLLSGALTTGVLMVAWPNWILHRRGQGTEESYATLDRWRLSHGVIVGMLALFAFSFVLAYAGMPNGEAVYATVGSLFEVCFLIQGAGSLSRLLKRWGWTGWKHNVVVALAVTVFSFGFVFYGCASALFGSQGVVTEYLRRRQNKNNSDR